MPNSIEFGDAESRSAVPRADEGVPDALPFHRARGRGAALNPGNRFDRGADGRRGTVRLHILGEHLERERRERPGADGAPAARQVETTIVPDRTQRVINRVDSPDLPFHWTLNPYRGCEHGCVYCYARPTHELLGESCGLDFETRIHVKHDAARLLERELGRRAWRGEPIAMCGVTDAYQPLERTLGITRGCLEVMARCRQPVSIVTKSRLVTRDIDLLGALARHDAAHVAMSITTLDPGLARAMEPRAAAPRDRLRAVRELTDAGVPVSVMIAPIIPGLTDHEVPALLDAAAGAGAAAASWVLLRLPHQVKDVFIDWVRRERPDRAERVLRAIRATRDGALYDGRFGHRQRGAGPEATTIARVFGVFAARHGLADGLPALSSDAFRPPLPDGQLGLFDG